LGLPLFVGCDENKPDWIEKFFQYLFIYLFIYLFSWSVFVRFWVLSIVAQFFFQSMYKFGLSVCFGVWVSVCLFVSNKRQTG